MADDPQPQPKGVAVKGLWVDLDETHVLATNQYIVQAQDGEFVLSLGHMTPPMPPMAHGKYEIKDLVEQVDYVPVRTVFRTSMTIGNIRKLHNLLDRVVKDNE